MFERLKKKWKVSGPRLALIICTFAIGGSVTGYIGKKIMNGLAISEDWLWTIIYILLITIIWPLAVLIISIPFGQFRFFSSYIRKIGARMGIVGSRESGVRSRESGVRSQESGIQSQESGIQSQESGLPTPDSRLQTQLAIFASGAGTNAQKIIDYFASLPSPPGEGLGVRRVTPPPKIIVSLIVCNNPAASVLKIAEKENIPALLLEKEKFFRGNAYLDKLKEKQIDFIVLAGFLWKIPLALIKAYPNRIINIHPALLPDYGGRGMYGENVHAAVIAAGEKESGITIHYVDEHYDNGDIIFQLKCPVLPGDTPGSLAQRIHKLEHEHYPRVIEKVVGSLIS